MTELSNRIVIQSKARGAQAEIQFFLDIQEAWEKGYRIAQTGTMNDTSRRLYKGHMGRVCMYLESEDVTKVDSPHTYDIQLDGVDGGGETESKIPVEDELTPLQAAKTAAKDAGVNVGATKNIEKIYKMIEEAKKETQE